MEQYQKITGNLAAFPHVSIFTHTHIIYTLACAQQEEEKEDCYI